VGGKNVGQLQAATKPAEAPPAKTPETAPAKPAAGTPAVRNK
jgi:hypothetical protein